MLEFQKRQLAFSQRIRHGAAAAYPENIPPQRMQVYQDNFFAGIDEILSNCFPIVNTILVPSLWRTLVADFYANHPLETPLFSEIPATFLSYLVQTADKSTTPAFLIELAHYEWMELVIEYRQGTATAATVETVDFDSSLLTTSELAEVVAYHFPVHQICKDFMPILPGPSPTYLCIYRNADDEVKFIELNVASTRLLQQLKQQRQSSAEVMTAIAKETQQPNINAFIEENRKILNELLSIGVIHSCNNRR
ncbi:MAG: hypothetical protein GY821_06205 [Gammaproteobacteria bacterium]|nr:hypothetical protein [Gammaproteobacteria bacterium]